MEEQNKKSVWEILAAGVLGIGLVFVLTFLLVRVPASAMISVDESMKNRMEDQNGDNGPAASLVQAAESSRQKRIQDSIAYSRYLEESAAASLAESVSVEESLEESSRQADRSSRQASLLAAASSYREMLESLAAESAAEESRLAEIEASLEAVRQASIEESIRESIEESSRQASIEQSIEDSKNATTEQYVGPGGEVVFIGDSRTYGFDFYDCWPHYLVFFTTGTIGNSPELNWQAAACNPAKIVFCSGIDDIGGYGYERAIVVYENYIKEFHRISPATGIYVAKVLPVNEVGINRISRLAYIDQYNVLLEDMCARNGWNFVSGMDGFTFEWAYGAGGGDGIHFSASWTRQWFNNIRSEVGF